MISSISYNGDGSTRIFPVTFKINGEDYVRVYVDNVEVVDRTKYDIINNSIVFTSDDIPAVGTDNIKIYVATSSSELGDLGAPLTDITNVSNNLAEIVAVSTQVIPNLPEILLADNNATIATNQATIATTKASEASASAISASNSATTATTKASEALASATSASNSATSASNSANTATTKANEASSSASSALISANNAEASANLAQQYANTLDHNLIVEKDSPTGAAYIPVGTTAQRPTTPSNGYLRYNTDLVSMEAYSNGAWGSVGGGATGGGTDHIFNLNGQVINSNYTIPTGMNAVTAGDVTIATGVTVTVPTGSKWVIV